MNVAAQAERRADMESRSHGEPRAMPSRPREIPEDEALLHRIGERDETAFHLVYRRHASAVMAVAYRLLHDREIAAEITQQTFLRLWDRARTIDPSAGRLRPWLLLVARNAALDQGRRKRLGFALLDRAFSGTRSEPDIADAIVEGFRLRETRDLLGTLAEEQRLVIELAYFGELTQAEIATMLELPLGTIKSRIRLALGHLRARAASVGLDRK